MLTILIVNYNSADFIKNNLYSFAKLNSLPYQVLIADNYSKVYDRRKLKRLNAPNVKIFWQVSNQKGSMAHGLALDFLVQK